MSLRELIDNAREYMGWASEEELNRISEAAESMREDLAQSICGIRETTAKLQSARQSLPTLTD